MTSTYVPITSYVRIAGSAMFAAGVTEMTICRTIEQVQAAADADSRTDPPLTQATADLVAAILTPYRAREAA